MKKRVTIILIAGLCAVGLGFLPRVTAPATKMAMHLGGAPLPPVPTLCICYYADDCRTRHALCTYGSSCLPQGKNHGLCDLAAVPPSDATSITNEQKAAEKAERAALSNAIDSYFHGFLKAIEQGGCHPDPKLVAAALDTRLSQNGHNRVETAVWVSLDAVTTFGPLYMCAPRALGSLPSRVFVLYRGDNRIEACSTKNRRDLGLG